MIVHVERAVEDRCWNLYDSYGEICVGCGCCSPDKDKRYKSRIAVLEQQIAEFEHFDGWFEDDPEMKAVQEKNIRNNLRSFRRMLRYYKKRLEI